VKNGSQPSASAGLGKPGAFAGCHICFLLVCFVLAAAARDKTNFFTNVASRLLQSELNLSLTHLQIFPTNQYTPAVHRLLQVAANLYDATTNRFDDTYPHLPTVFRPVFNKTVRNGRTNVCISGYTEVTNVSQGDLPLSQPFDLENPNDVAKLRLGHNYINAFGVPWVIGVKKGLPNFNEFSMQTVAQVTRKLEIQRPSVGARPATFTTNMMYIIGISNMLGVELWNSYRTNYTRPVDIYVTNWLTMALTNDFGVPTVLTSTSFGAYLPIPNPTNSVWPGYNIGNPGGPSFQVPLLTNIALLPDSTLLSGPPPSLAPGTNFGFQSFPSNNPFPWVQWGLSITNRLLCYMVDRATGRLIDYVQLNGLNSYQNLSAEIVTPGSQAGINGLWNTNASPAGTLSGFPGVVNQIFISLGEYFSYYQDWNDYGINQPGGATKQYLIDSFRAFYGLSSLFGNIVVNTNLTQQVPFTPARRVMVYQTWQANDPLVHYMAADLADLTESNSVTYPSLTSSIPPLRNIGWMNTRYQPWGGYPYYYWLTIFAATNAYNLAIKDPLVRFSDDWNFPDSKSLRLLILGRVPRDNHDWREEGENVVLPMLGSVHRGTPWQTIYLKSPDITANPTGGISLPGLAAWQIWTGNANDLDALNTAPVRDWHLASLLVSLFDAKDRRELLSVNDPSRRRWLELLGGLTVLTNTPSSPPLTALVMSSRSPQAALLADAISRTRASQTNHLFREVGDVLGTPELSVASPWLDRRNTNVITDEAYEIIPSQLLPLLRPDSVGRARFEDSIRHDDEGSVETGVGSPLIDQADSVLVQQSDSVDEAEKSPPQLLSLSRPESIGSILPTNGGVHLQFSGRDGFPYAVEVSTNLFDWMPISTNYPSNGVFNFRDAVTPDSDRRFYRSVLRP
jgi:hypothetical protein